MEPKRERFVDPRYTREYEGITPSAQRLGKVVDCLSRDDIPDLSPLETFVVERSIEMFLRHGFIGSPTELTWYLIQGDPPERMYTNGDTERKNDLSGILQSLEGKGILVLDQETEKYSLGTQPNNPNL